jgi:hypothetical protein
MTVEPWKPPVEILTAWACDESEAAGKKGRRSPAALSRVGKAVVAAAPDPGGPKAVPTASPSTKKESVCSTQSMRRVTTERRSRGRNEMPKASATLTPLHHRLPSENQAASKAEGEGGGREARRTECSRVAPATTPRAKGERDRSVNSTAQS